MQCITYDETIATPLVISYWSAQKAELCKNKSLHLDCARLQTDSVYKGAVPLTDAGRHLFVIGSCIDCFPEMEAAPRFWCALHFARDFRSQGCDVANACLQDSPQSKNSRNNHTVVVPYKTGSRSVFEVSVVIRSVPKPSQWLI